MLLTFRYKNTKKINLTMAKNTLTFRVLMAKK